MLLPRKTVIIPDLYGTLQCKKHSQNDYSVRRPCSYMVREADQVTSLKCPVAGAGRLPKALLGS